MQARPRWNSNECAKTHPPTVVKLFTVTEFILVPGPDRRLVGIEIVRGTWDRGLKPSECYQVCPDHAYFAIGQIIDSIFEKPINLIKTPGRKAGSGPTVSRVTAVPSGINLFSVCQRRQELDPWPRVIITDPLPETRTVAQYDTNGPQRNRILLFGRMGVSPVVACTVESEPNLM
jgi:hypothetical protein